jgi:hypothetical protein
MYFCILHTRILRAPKNTGSALYGAAGAGMILRDVEGHINFSACRSLYQCGPVLEEELGAYMQGIALALHWSQEPIIVETDCHVREDRFKQ